MADNTKVALELILKNQQYLMELQKTNKKTQGFFSSFGKGAGVVKGFMGLGIISAIGGIGKSAIKAAVDMEKYQASFETMLGSADRAKSLIVEMKDFAAATPFTFPDLAKSSQTLLQFGIEGEKVLPILQMLGDVAGADSERMKSLALVFGQIQSTGKLMGQDLLQLINQGFNPLQQISEKTGKSVSQLKDEMSKGAISADMVTEAFKDATSEGGRFFEGMKKQSQTLGGLMSTLEDNIGQAAEAMGNEMVPILKELTAGLIENKDAIKEMGKGIGWLGSQIFTLIPGVQSLLDHFRLMAEIRKKLAKIEKGSVADRLNNIKKQIAGAYQVEQSENRITAAVKKKGKAKKEIEALTELEILRFQKVKSFNDEFQLALLQENEAYKTLLENKKITQEQEVEAFTLHYENLFNIVKTFEDKKQQEAMQAGMGVLKFAANSLNQMSQLYSMQTQNIMMNLDIRKNRELKSVEDSTMSEDAKQKAVERINQKYDQKRLAAQIKAAKMQKKISLMETAVTTPIMAAQAFKAMAGIPIVGPFLGYAAAAAATAFGLTKMSLIKNQPLPQAEFGGVIPGSAAGTQLIAGEKNKSEAIIPLEDSSIMDKLGTKYEIHGNVFGIDGMMEAVDKARNSKATSMGMDNYATDGVY